MQKGFIAARQVITFLCAIVVGTLGACWLGCGDRRQRKRRWGVMVGDLVALPSRSEWLRVYRPHEREWLWAKARRVFYELPVTDGCSRAAG